MPAKLAAFPNGETVRRLLTLPDLETLTWVDSLRAPSFHWTLEQLKSLEPSHEFWGWEENGRITAWVALATLPGASEITALATHPDFRRRGQMRSLLQDLINSKRQDTEIWLEVHEANESAMGLYRALGFAEVGRRPRYYSDGSAALLFTRK